MAKVLRSLSNSEPTGLQFRATTAIRHYAQRSRIKIEARRFRQRAFRYLGRIAFEKTAISAASKKLITARTIAMSAARSFQILGRQGRVAITH
jgi:hypothetical protein